MLLAALEASAPARIVNVASAGQMPIDFDDVMLERDYNGVRAYCQSKLAQIMFTIDLAEELDGKASTVNALHPATYMPTKMVSSPDQHAGGGRRGDHAPGRRSRARRRQRPLLQRTREARADPQADDRTPAGGCASSRSSW